MLYIIGESSETINTYVSVKNVTLYIYVFKINPVVIYGIFTEVAVTSKILAFGLSDLAYR